MTATNSTVWVQNCLDRLRAGDVAAIDPLLERSLERLRHLATKMLGADFPRLQRWEDADDVLQNAALRLYRHLREQAPATPLDFYRFAALHIRRELHDMARRYFGPHGVGANHVSTAESSIDTPRFEATTDTRNPAKLAEWTEFHRAAESLPEAERAVFDLLWYQDVGQEEASALLGVDVRTVQRRWRNARLTVQQQLGPLGGAHP